MSGTGKARPWWTAAGDFEPWCPICQADAKADDAYAEELLEQAGLL